MNILSWIHWDPPRFAFTIPFINRPVAWYGIFFALGFIIGFLIVLPIFKKKLLQTQKLLARDIISWPLLINNLKQGSKSDDPVFSLFFRRLNKQTQEKIIGLKFKQEPDEDLKEDILRVLNLPPLSHKPPLSRSQLESFFPRSIYRIKDLCLYLTDRLTWFVIGGAIVGARLVHVFFYDWPRYQNHPFDIIKIWEGGIASHGGAIGIMLALWIYKRVILVKFPEFSFLDLLDILCIPTAFAAVCIRIGNLFNQELLGPVTTAPWGIIFGHPYDGGAILPRHPAPLYEAIAYLLTFGILYTLWKKKGDVLKPGTLIGIFFILVFGSRFLIEYLKDPLSMVLDETYIKTGQLLSLPFIVFGLWLLIPSFKRLKRA